ncbi:hypothetical protein [Pseudovibrio sp. Tun.PSC04-5.I4]|uniref:hypothetical protein n=1 Tax=Pseudovibrio sp. Tun.PSC04-5.I4 TaxID=1798213 RepID=UPI000891871A|nr:hypothetical protein [Pseudovibrio sp. Tun.PSC04-5.I4]SDR34821.1 hypothetical protein SAMN04515695_4782 [Pseudovibrio sp. Tun.PSC04-5.I4]
METDDIRRELEGIKASIRRKPGRGWVIAASILSTLLVLVLIAGVMMFMMMNHMRSMDWRGYVPDRLLDQPFKQPPPPPPPGQPLPR